MANRITTRLEGSLGALDAVAPARESRFPFGDVIHLFIASFIFMHTLYRDVLVVSFQHMHSVRSSGLGWEEIVGVDIAKPAGPEAICAPSVSCQCCCCLSTGRWARTQLTCQHALCSSCWRRRHPFAKFLEKIACKPVKNAMVSGSVGTPPPLLRSSHGAVLPLFSLPMNVNMYANVHALRK